jgi:hypothetical protein
MGSLLVLATMAPMMTDRPNGLEIEPGHGGNDIEPGLALDAHWLKREGVVESTDEAVGPDANAHCCPTGNANITARQCTRAHARGSCEDGPAQRYIIGNTDLGSEAVHSALIVLGRSAGGWREDTIECARRQDDKA